MQKQRVIRIALVALGLAAGALTASACPGGSPYEPPADAAMAATATSALS